MSRLDPQSLHRVARVCVLVALAAFALPAMAVLHNGYHIDWSVNGSGENVSGQLTSNGPGVSKSVTANGATVEYTANASQFTSAKASLAGSGSGTMRIKTSTAYEFKLVPPTGANVKGGRLVLEVLLEGTAVGNADLHLVMAVQSDMGKGTNSAIISDANTPKVAFSVEVPIAPFIDNFANVESTAHLTLDATAKLTGGVASKAEASNSTRVTGFRVLNPAGAQVPGFVMTADGGNIPELAAGPTPPPVTGKFAAVEFYNASYKHYFLSANSAEIAKLDDGTFAGWTRTGLVVNVNLSASAGLTAVCRFYTVAFPPTSSHFYAPRGLGCEGTLTNNKWQYEGEVFWVPLPNDVAICPAGSMPVYRLYNNGRGGAPNHRFTTSEAVRSQMIAEGFISEGVGVGGVGFCSPQ